jgi:acetolactate synthase-1/2/3 large subunit
MGYGLAGAMGTCFANPESRVISVEGDGGFLQNLSEISTVVHHNLNLKIFIFINNGYASIKLSQKGNFDGHYVGCDPETGVAIPDLKRILLGFDLPVYEIRSTSDQEALTSILDEPGPAIGLVHIHPDQTYFPKIVSRMSTTGVIESNPIHLMYPDLPPGILEPVSKFLKSDAKMDDND